MKRSVNEEEPKNMDDKNRKTTLNGDIIHIVNSKHPKTVGQLVELVHKKHPLPQQEIVDHILDLQNQGKLDLKENTAFVPVMFNSYLLSSHAQWYWIIIAIAIATAVAVIAIPENAYPIIYARHLLGSIFVLLLPGYSLLRVLFPTKELDNIERVVLSIGISLALVSLTGLVLNYTPYGVRTGPVTLSILALTTVFATTALVREHRIKLAIRA